VQTTSKSHQTRRSLRPFDLAAIAVCYAATLGLLGWVGLQREMGVAFFGGLAVAAAIALYHMKLIWQRDPQQCFRAFLHNTCFGAAVFRRYCAQLSAAKLMTDKPRATAGCSGRPADFAQAFQRIRIFAANHEVKIRSLARQQLDARAKHTFVLDFAHRAGAPLRR